MIAPDLLKPGDNIGILAPARKINSAEVDFAMKTLSSWGLKPVLSANIYSNKHSYLSGTDSERQSDFQAMLEDHSIRAILCARGGYGSTRIIDDIGFSVLRQDPKWIIGFSDITAIHLTLLHLGVASIHGTMPILFSKPSSKVSVESLRKVLFEGECLINGPAVNHNKLGQSQGRVIGGNLSLVADSLGTRSEPDTRGTILFLEEIDEYLYKVDRMLTQLRRAGKLENLKGMIIGHMTDIKDSELPFGKTVEEIVLDAVKQYDYPVAFNFPSGHENPNLAWIHGGTATLSVTSNGSQLSYDSFRKSTVS
jgi:muramoyltetrapeptide carboxypeptidase